MGLFNREETEKQQLKRLSKHAGNVVEMLKGTLKGPQGTDMTIVLLYAAGLAGCACHEAVKAEGGTFAKATTTNGRSYYLSDDVNKYLLENPISVCGFVKAVSSITDDDVRALVVAVVQSLGTDDFKIWGMEPDGVYKGIRQCWDGILETMTKPWCKRPSEWPIFYSIVLQNVILQAISIGAPADEIGKMAMSCAIPVSRMDTDSLVSA